MNYDITVHRIVKQKKVAGEYIERHSHKYFHYIYIFDGVGVVDVGDNSLSATSRHLFMIPPNTEHAVYAMSEFNSVDIKFSCGGGLEQKLYQIGYCVKDFNSYEESLIKNIIDEAVMSGKMMEDFINIQFMEILFRVIRRDKDGIYMQNSSEIITSLFAEPITRKSEKITDILRYINANICNQIKVSELAQYCNYSENYFSIYFKNYMGCPVTQYINRKKINKAKEMMLTTQMNITQISQYLGFESVHYFSRVFKKIAGMSPLMYYSRANSDIGINIVKESEFTPKTYFEYPVKLAKDYIKKNNS